MARASRKDETPQEPAVVESNVVEVELDRSKHSRGLTLYLPEGRIEFVDGKATVTQELAQVLRERGHIK